MAKNVYRPDITVGENPQLRGHWMDRLPAMDADIALVARQMDRPRQGDVPEDLAPAAIQAALARPQRRALACTHQPAAKFPAGQPLNLDLSVERAAQPVSVRVYYRRVTQAERFLFAEMRLLDGRYRVAIPGTYTDSQYPLQYYFGLKRDPASAWLYPGFAADLTGQPYFVVRRA